MYFIKSMNDRILNTGENIKKDLLIAGLFDNKLYSYNLKTFLRKLSISLSEMTSLY